MRDITSVDHLSSNTNLLLSFHPLFHLIFSTSSFFLRSSLYLPLPKIPPPQVIELGGWLLLLNGPYIVRTRMRLIAPYYGTNVVSAPILLHGIFPTPLFVRTPRELDFLWVGGGLSHSSCCKVKWTSSANQRCPACFVLHAKVGDPRLLKATTQYPLDQSLCTS